VKYILQGARTLWVLFREHPDIVIVENPPFVLPLVALIYTVLGGKKLLIDSATGAFYDPKWKWSNFMFRFLARRAKVNIVTNDELARVVNSWGAEAYVLENCLPDLAASGKMELRKGVNIAVINTFSFDEPIAEILGAAKELPDVNFYITGDTRLADKGHLKGAPENVIFTGYLTEPDPFFALLRAADAIMVLCTVDSTLCAGMYEAVSLGKPLIASDWEVMRRFFRKGVAYVDNTSEGIGKGVTAFIENADRLREEMSELREDLHREWPRKLSLLEEKIKGKD